MKKHLSENVLYIDSDNMLYIIHLFKDLLYEHGINKFDDVLKNTWGEAVFQKLNDNISIQKYKKVFQNVINKYIDQKFGTNINKYNSLKDFVQNFITQNISLIENIILKLLPNNDFLKPMICGIVDALNGKNTLFNSFKNVIMNLLNIPVNIFCPKLDYD